MGNQTATSGLDFEAMRHAIEERNAEALIGFYAEDAELHTVNRNSTPSSPQVLRGKEQIGQHLRDVCSREMTHRVQDEVVGEGRIAFNEACEYPNGTRVLEAENLEVLNGKIIRQVSDEAWDE